MASVRDTTPTTSRGDVRHVAQLRAVPGGTHVEVAAGEVLRLRRPAPRATGSWTVTDPVVTHATVTRRRADDGHVARGSDGVLARLVGRVVGMVVLLMLWARLWLRDGDPAAAGVLVFLAGWVAFAVWQDGRRGQTRSR